MINEPFGEAAAETVAQALGAVEMGPAAALEGAPDGQELAAPYLSPAEATRAPGEEAKKTPAKPSARALTITIVLATFMAAIGGLLLNRASAAASNAADVAQELSLEANAAGTSAYQQAETDYSQYVSLQALKAQAAQEMLEATYDQEGTQTWADLYRSTSAEVAEAAPLVPADLQPDLANGAPDPDFPADFFAKRALAGTFLAAKSDAYNDVSNKWSTLVDSYAAILTMIAVALFLFGSAYVLFGRNRVLFSVLGGALVLTGTAWGAVVTVTRQAGAPSGAAAMDYANGLTAMDEAGAPANYRTAIADFTAAIRLRPDYALAYEERADAELLQGSETLGAGYLSVIAPHWQRLAARDLIEAYRLGDRDATQTLDVGYSYYSLWISGGGAGHPPPQAVEYFQKATQLDPMDPTDWEDLGVSEVASGQFSAGAAAFRAALTNMLYTCSVPGELSSCDKPQPSSSYGLQHTWLADGLQVLDNLSGTKDALASAPMRADIADMEGLFAASMAEGKIVPGPYTVLPGEPELSGFVDPSYLGLYVRLPKGAPAAGRSVPVAVLWYERPAGEPRWIAMTATACWGHGAELCEGYDPEDRTLGFVSSFLATDNDCFTNLEYRAVVYMDGTLSGSLTLGPQDDFITTNLAPALDKAMNMGICLPSNWAVQPLRELVLKVYGTGATVTGALTGSEFSYASPGDKQGVYVFRLYPPRSLPSGAQETPEQLVQTGQAYAVAVLRGIGLPYDITARGTSYYDLWQDSPVSDMAETSYFSPTGTDALVGAALLGPRAQLSPALEDDWAKKYVTSDYAVVVTVVYGPTGSQFWVAAHSLSLQIFSSWSLLSYG